MSFRANSFFEMEIPCFAEGIRCSFREQGIHANPLILPCHQARGPPKTGKSGAIFEDSLLNSLLAGNCGRRKQGFPRPAAASLKEASLTNPECLPGRAVSRETKHERNLPRPSTPDRGRGHGEAVRQPDA